MLEAGKAELGEQLAGQINCGSKDRLRRRPQGPERRFRRCGAVHAERRTQDAGQHPRLFNATLALLKHVENCGWNERFAEQALPDGTCPPAGSRQSAACPPSPPTSHSQLKGEYGIPPERTGC